MGYPSVAVVVPSYGRPERLRDCLDAVRELHVRPDEVVVVVRETDHATLDEVERRGDDNLAAVTVSQPGVLAAMIAGVRQTRSEIIVFFDDDTVPRPDWLSRVLGHFQMPNVGGVGGRDIVTQPDDLPRRAVAGIVRPWGRIVGEHHVVCGNARPVHVLKGANLAFRREALALPTTLRGDGAQMHWEVATSLWAINQGWTLTLDPAAEVLHLPGMRYDDDQRERPSLAAAYRSSYNLSQCLLTMKPRMLVPRLLYGLVVGDRGDPGVVRGLLAIIRGETVVRRRFVPSMTGQITGAFAAVRGRGVEMTTFASRSRVPSQP